MLWLIIVVCLVFLGAAQRAPSPQARSAWLAALVALVSLTIATRLGARFLVVAAPTLAWLAWRALTAKAPSGAPPPFGTRSGAAMTREEALRVLGLREGASQEAIRDAHRNLIKKVHPDHGGSDVLAQQVNEAKRVLE
ncbi:MAG TPA: DnaJ domain-containing protein [Polyangiaceae bacterium]